MLKECYCNLDTFIDQVAKIEKLTASNKKKLDAMITLTTPNERLSAFMVANYPYQQPLYKTPTDTDLQVLFDRRIKHMLDARRLLYTSTMIRLMRYDAIVNETRDRVYPFDYRSDDLYVDHAKLMLRYLEFGKTFTVELGNMVCGDDPYTSHFDQALAEIKDRIVHEKEAGNTTFYPFEWCDLL